MGKKNASVKIVCENRKARHDYFIHETYEAGIVFSSGQKLNLFVLAKLI